MRLTWSLPARAREAVLEETTLLASLAKWTLLATVVGGLAGTATAGFLAALDRGIRMVGGWHDPLWLLPVGLLASYLLVRLLAAEAAGHGTDRVIEAVHRRWGRIPLLVAPVKLAATVVTIAAGGSVGKEGPAAQIGATLASAFASVLRLKPRDRRKVVICGIGAGFATVFGTPIAGAVFGLEVLVLGTVFYDVLYPSFVAGMVGFQVAQRLGVTYFHQELYSIPRPTEGIFLKTLLAGVLFGLIALLLIEAMRAAEWAAHRLPGPRWALVVAGGAVLAGLAWLTSPRYLGLGIPTLEASVRGAWVPAEAFALKIVFTAISLAAGGSGGVVTPIFFVGATAGSTLGSVLGFDRGTFAAIGMVSVLAGAANTPLAASIMAIELFGPAVGPFAAISCIVAFLMTGHRSVYGSQILGRPKSASVVVRPGVPLAHRGEVRTRPARLRRTRVLRRLLARAWRRRRSA